MSKILIVIYDTGTRVEVRCTSDQMLGEQIRKAFSRMLKLRGPSCITSLTVRG